MQHTASHPKSGQSLGDCDEVTRFSVCTLQSLNGVNQHFGSDGVPFLMTKNRHECFEANLLTLQASREVTLSFGLTRDFPVGCLLCLVKEVIYFPRSKDQGKSSPPPQKPASFTSLTIPLKHRNVNIPRASY